MKKEIIIEKVLSDLITTPSNLGIRRVGEKIILTKHIKEKVQNAERRLKEEIKNKDAKFGNYSLGLNAENLAIEIIDEIFKEEFGDKLR